MEFYKLSEKSKKYWLDKGEDYNRNNHENYKVHKLEHIIFAGVKEKCTEWDKYMIPVKLSNKDIAHYKKLDKVELIPMTLNKIKKISLKILNYCPMLQGFTCMAWEDDLRINDPNYYSGNYIFPDGNLYTIIKKRNRVEVYPGEGDHCLMMNDNQLPLVKYKIHIEKWAEIIENPKSKVKITELK